MDTPHHEDFLNNVDLNQNLTVRHRPYDEIFTTSTLNILSININSIRNKINELHLYLSNFKSTVHIICITEIRLRPDELYLCHLNDYIEICSPRSSRAGGGACIFIHRSLAFETVVNEEFFEGSAIVVELRSPKLKIGVVYRPPHADLTASVNFIDMLLENHNGMVCVGDYNINLLSPSSTQYQSMVTSNGYSILNRLDAHSFTHGNSLSGSIIDHGYTDVMNYEYAVGLHDISFSDHRAMLISLNGIPNVVAQGSVKEVLKYNLEQAVLDFDRVITQATNLNEFCILTSDVIKTNSKKVKIKQKCNRKSPWIDEFVLNHIRIREHLFRRTLKWPTNQQVKQNYCRQKNYVTKIIRQKQKQYYSFQIESNRNNIRKVWNIMNQIINCRTTSNEKNSITEITEGGLHISDKTKICNAFNKYFIDIPVQLHSILKSQFNNRQQVCTLNTSITNSMVMLPASINEVGNYVREMKSSCSAGIDLIPAKFLKLNPDVILPTLTNFLNRSMLEGEFPETLKIARVAPIYKSGRKSMVENYRPISILSNLSKPYEKIIHTRLLDFFDRNDLINKNQFGFQPRSNTTSAVVSLVNDIQTNIDRKRVCSVIFLDVSKAFDCVPHNLLLQKLFRYGIRGNAHCLIQSYLKNRKQIVQLDGHTSREGSIEYGVPQGSILGPLLFIIFVNDVFDLPLKGTLVMYADDSALVYSSENIEELFENMQHDLNLINNWFYNNGLTVNGTKSKYMIFSSTDRYNTSNYNLHLGASQLERVQDHTYLGLVMQQNLKWNCHINSVHSKIVKFLGMLRRTSHMLSPKDRKNLYYAHVHSQITYMNIIWQNAPAYAINKIATTINKFMRIIFWEQYNNPQTRTVDLYISNNMLNFEQIKYYEAVLLVYKVKNNLIKNQLHLQSSRDIHRYDTRSADNLRIVTPRTNYLRLGCMFSAIVNFNNLPEQISNLVPINRFKKALKAHIMSL